VGLPMRRRERTRRRWRSSIPEAVYERVLAHALDIVNASARGDGAGSAAAYRRLKRYWLSQEAAREYAFASVTATPRTWTASQAVLLFRRDGYVDRYSGSCLVFPGALLVLSEVLPVQFPYHPNWKSSATHSAYYELYPTVDHVVPVTRGGLDAPRELGHHLYAPEQRKGQLDPRRIGLGAPPSGPLDGVGRIGGVVSRLSRFTSGAEEACPYTQMAGGLVECTCGITTA